MLRGKGPRSTVNPSDSVHLNVRGIILCRERHSFPGFSRGLFVDGGSSATANALVVGLEITQGEGRPAWNLHGYKGEEKSRKKDFHQVWYSLINTVPGSIPDHPAAPSQDVS